MGVQQSPVGAEVVPLGWGELGGSADMLPLESERNVHEDSFQEYEEAYAVPVGGTPALVSGCGPSELLSVSFLKLIS